MTVDGLLAQLAAGDVVLTVEGKRLLFDAPAGAMTADLRAGIAEHRAELIHRLASESTSPSAPAPTFPPDHFAEWLTRPDAAGKIGWEAPGLPEQDRWWARRTFDQLPGWLPDTLPGCRPKTKGR